MLLVKIRKMFAKKPKAPVPAAMNFYASDRAISRTLQWWEQTGRHEALQAREMDAKAIAKRTHQG